MIDKNTTLEEIEKKIREFVEKDKTFGDAFVKQLSPEEIESLKRTLGNFAISNMGDKIYRLPGGVITGEGGLRQFHEAVMEEVKKYGQ